jgi:hypothetical protein
MAVRVFSGESSASMTTRTYAARANGMAGAARVRVNGTCQDSPAVAWWMPISLGIDTRKHGRPRRTEVSHQ